MSSYTEKKDKNILQLSTNGNNQVTVTMNCYHGTTGKLTFIAPNNSPTISCGQTTLVDSVEALKKKGMIGFLGDFDNYDGLPSDVEFILQEVGGNTLTYRFPADYTGNPAVPNDEESPYLTFYCKFK